MHFGKIVAGRKGKTVEGDLSYMERNHIYYKENTAPTPDKLKFLFFIKNVE